MQNTMEQENVMVHFPDSYVPEDRTVVIQGETVVDMNNGHF